MDTVSVHSQPLLFTKEQQQKMDNTLMHLADRTASPLVLVTDVSGQLVMYRGRLSSSQSTALAALAAGSFGAGVEMGNFLGLRGEHAFQQQLHEGSAANLYTMAVGEELLLVIAFTKHTTLGLVRVYAQAARDEIMRLVTVAQVAREKATQAVDGMDAGFGSAVTEQLDELFPE